MAEYSNAGRSWQATATSSHFASFRFHVHAILILTMPLSRTQTNHLPKDSVGHIMTDRVPVVTPTQTVASVRQLLRDRVDQFDSVNYLYCLDQNRKLLGVISIKELLAQTDQTTMRDCMNTQLVTVRPHTHQEHMMYLALKHNLKAMPVVDEQHHWLGTVTNDQLMKIIYEEAHEDMLHLAGLHHAQAAFDNIQTLSLWQALRHRLPWLLIGVSGGLVAAGIIGVFEKTLTQHVVLAAFIPLVVYVADAVGTQMEAYIIRDLATTDQLKFFRYFMKQLGVIFWIGLIASALVFIVSWLWYREPKISGVISLTLIVAIVSSVFTGLVIPYLFSRLKFDPANASGPVATILQDIISVVVYFAIAQLLLF